MDEFLEKREEGRAWKGKDRKGRRGKRGDTETETERTRERGYLISADIR